MRDIVTQKSVADQIVELPLESIVLVHGVDVLDTVIHRTGPTGWLLTRGGIGYRKADTIRELVADYDRDGATFTVLREGSSL